jgi:hypothetical protein
MVWQSFIKQIVIIQPITTNELRKQRERTIERWKKLGLLDGLKGVVKQDVAKLFEGKLSWSLDDTH